MSVTAKPLMGSDPANFNALNRPMNVSGTKEAVPAGSLRPVNCDRKGSTSITNHVDVLFFSKKKKNNNNNIVPNPSENSQGSSRTSDAAWRRALDLKSRARSRVQVPLSPLSWSCLSLDPSSTPPTEQIKKKSIPRRISRTQITNGGQSQ